MTTKTHSCCHVSNIVDVSNVPTALISKQTRPGKQVVSALVWRDPTSCIDVVQQHTVNEKP